MSGLRSRKKALRSGASLSSEIRVGLSSRAHGRSSLITGLALWAKASSLLSVLRLSIWKVGRIVKASASCWFLSAVVWKTVLALVMRPLSWPRRSDSALNTSPVLRTRRCTAPCCVTRIFSRSLVSSANGARLPKASERSCPRPVTPTASDCIHTWKSWRVSSLKARKISSSSTVGETCAGASVPPSRSLRVVLVPGVSST